MSRNTAVFGIFKDRFLAERAVDSLKVNGFLAGDISVLFPDNEGTRDFAHEKATKAPEGAATGATSGAVIGGALGWLVGIGSLAIPGVGPFIAAGPIMAALAGAGVGGAVGGVAGGLIGLGIPEYEAKRYEGLVKDGGILLSVHCDDAELIDKAKEVLKTEGGNHIAATGETHSNIISGTRVDDHRRQHDGSLQGADERYATMSDRSYDKTVDLRNRDNLRDPTLPPI